jgi:hypothetical protein
MMPTIIHLSQHHGRCRHHHVTNSFSIAYNYRSIASIEIMDTSFESREPALSAEQRFIDSETGLPNFRRFTEHNIEDRTVAARALYREGFYPSISAAARAWKVGYKRLLGRCHGSHPVRDNGGNRTLFSREEEKAILAWCWRRITQGHHIQQRTLRQYANSMLKATDRQPHASRF